ncbi:MAG: hypothetical protein FJX75_25755 [Armatimonadetes bacterium]|nr:hypothetical protein [Armatimonadota bacterium]
MGTGRASAEYLYTRRESETRSLHHYVYSLFESHLCETQQLKDVDVAFAEEQWSANAFQDGEFVRVSGRIRVLDYTLLAGYLRHEMPGIAAGLNGLVESQVPAPPGAGRARLTEQTVRKWQAEVSHAERLCGGAIRVKVQPSPTHRGRFFISRIPREQLAEALGALGPGWCVDLPSTWVVVGQANVLGEPPEPHARLPIGDPVEDQAERIALAAQSLYSAINSPDPPSCPLPMTIIAIYRYCPEPRG